MALRKGVAVGVLLCASNLLADHIVIPEAFNILSVNGVKPKWSLFAPKRKIKLKEGVQRIDLQYSDFYDQGFDDHEKVKSEPFYIEFNYVGGDLKTDFVRPEDLAEARKYASNPHLKIVQVSSKKEVSSKVNPTEKKSASVSEKVTRKVEVEPNRRMEVETIATKKTKNQVDSDQPSAIRQLKYWWGKASLEERKAFMKEILK